ncbi:MAG: O-antigen ligase family protein, partial [Candidatus Eiseniibacteriota bacterium]
MIFGIVLAEAVVLALGVLLDQPYLGVAAAAALLYLVLAYRRPGIAWMLAWLAFPFSVDRLVAGGHALYLPLEPMIVLSLVAWIFRLQIGKPLRVPASELHLPLAALAGVTALSIVFSHYRHYGVYAMIAASFYVAFGYLFCCVSRGGLERMDRWAPWVVGSAALWGLYGAGRVVIYGVTYRAAYGAGRPFFTEHGAYAAYLAMILPLALLLTVARRGIGRLGYAVASFAIALGILLSLTRAAWVSLALVLPVVFFLWAWRERTFRPVAWMAGVATLVILVLAGLGAKDLVSRHVETVADVSDVSNLERFNRWMAAVEMLRAKPLLGVGFNAYAQEYGQYRRKTIITELAYQKMSSHSEPMRLLAETGVTGFLAACWLLAAATLLGLR